MALVLAVAALVPAGCRQAPPFHPHPTRYGAPLQLRLLNLTTGRSTESLGTIGSYDYYGLHDWAGTAAWFQP